MQVHVVTWRSHGRICVHRVEEIVGYFINFIHSNPVMYRKQMALTLSFLIFCSFFTPLFEWHSFEMSGLNYILSSHIPSYKYLLLLVPFSTVALFFGTLNDEKYPIDRNLLLVLPFFVSVFVLLMRYFVPESSSDNSLFAEIDMGYWMMLGFSTLLLFTKRRKKVSHY